MKRSTGVSVAAISLIVASAAYCLHVFWTMPPIGRKGFGIVLAGSVFTLAFTVWGVATGVALLRLRHWAWLCVLTIAALITLYAIPQLLGASKLIHATTGMPTVGAGRFISHQYFQLVGFGVVPLILGIWWLVLFTRRSVRLQFASVASVGEEISALPRSDAVTIAAIVLFIGSGFLLLLAVMMPFIPLTPTEPAPPFPLRAMLIGIAFVYVLIAAWGIVTGVGVLKRRPWGRILMIVTAALGAALSVFGSLGVIIGPLTTQTSPEMSASAVRVAVITGIVILLIPLGISVWWLVLFTRPRVALEFASSGVPPAPASVPLPAIAAQSELVHAQLASFSVPEIPLSIRIVAVLEILFAALRFFSPLYSELTNLKVPVLVFGFLVHGWGINAFYVIFAVAPIVFCVAILRRRYWGLGALGVFLVAEIVNIALMIVSPARTRLNSELQSQMQTFMGRMNIPASSAPPFPFAHVNLFQDVSFGISILFYVVLLYFVFTRRKAFRAACDVDHSSLPA